MIYINRSLGQAMVDDMQNYTLSYTLEQEWKEDVVSYNVIGQLNGTSASDDYVLIGCLYDGWFNQAVADSAIGMGIMLAIAKCLQELNETNVRPKTTIRFVAFSGEEAGLRGAYSYLKEHQNDNISLIIDLNQLGYIQSDPRQALWVFSNNLTMNASVAAIASDTDFMARVNNFTDFHAKNTTASPYLSDHTPFYRKGGYNILSFVKEDTNFNYSWRLHHRDGLNHTEGDTMKYYDDNEVKITAELIWNVTKYFVLNPDCRFNGSLSYSATDSPNDPRFH